MKKHHNSNRAILVLECPWDLDEGTSNRSSVLPFIEGIAKLAGDTEVYHANFYDKQSFKKALGYLCRSSFQNAVVYVAAHGYRNKIAGVSIIDLLCEIGFEAKNCNITGVMLGSCYVGKENYAMEACTEGTHIKWCAGYTSSCLWLEGTMIDSAIIATMLSLDEDDYEHKEHLIGQIASAIRPFSRSFVIGDDYKGNPVTLQQSLQFVVQPRGQGNRAKTVSAEVFQAYEAC